MFNLWLLKFENVTQWAAQIGGWFKYLGRYSTELRLADEQNLQESL